MQNQDEIIKPGLFGNDAFADTRREEFDIKNESIIVNNIPVDICFIGDSITSMWDTSAFFSKYGTTINRGIGGDIADIMVKRFDADVIQLHPKIAVSLIGFNNITQLKAIKDENSEEYKQKEEEIIDTVVASWKEIILKCIDNNQKLVMCSILPTVWSPEFNHIIFRLNDKLRELCKEYNTPLADYHPRFIGGDELSINWDYSVDGTHPNGRGFKLMTDILSPILDEILS